MLLLLYLMRHLSVHLRCFISIILHSPIDSILVSVGVVEPGPILMFPTVSQCVAKPIGSCMGPALHALRSL
jgi:hypothetical protein